MTRRWSVPLLLLAAACGQDPAPPDAAPVPTAPPVTDVATGPVEPELAHFSSPTGNIGCNVSADGAGCEIRDHTWRLPPRPADCADDWTGGLVVDDRGRTVVGRCGTDTNLGAERVLAYGTAVQVGDLRCTSERAGMTCVDVGTGHGFTLSRTAYRVF